jgi:hypothetical protein
VPAELVEFQPEAILEVLARHGVDCVVIGGLAAYLQGSAFITEDVDITPKADLDNYARLATALDELEAKVRAAGVAPLPFGSDARSLLDVAIWNLTTKFGDLDITTAPSGTQGYDDLRRDAVTIRLGGGTAIVVASLADIVRSKSAANRDKDRRVLPALRELLADRTKEIAETRRLK